MKAIKYILYIFIQWTWGFIQSFIGLMLFIKYAAKGNKHVFYHGAIMTYHEEGWGGVSLGMFTFVNGTRSQEWLKDAASPLEP